MALFDQADADAIDSALQNGEALVKLGRATQAEVDLRRTKLHQAALAQPEPIEILTISFGGSEIWFKVRRFNNGQG